MEKKVIKIKETDNWPNTTRLEMIERSEVYDKPVLYQYGYYDGYQKCYKRLKADNEVLLNALKSVQNIVSFLINPTPTGDNRDRLTHANILSLEAIKEVES